ncbi:condensation domain-containing protein [Phytohabitans suffuscus]|uniref:Condensation domain-containing protein n=1 Tax=Phytohabitans suffuscus TaxID=624315 RepID=A0A6F8YUA6_9ACTN|nr:condensation domain-containing protein [Phytohabitans suffuscus]BCB89730.1 hypothetical protein Psuf_070430 [Phytohabitans suffuscus]
MTRPRVRWTAIAATSFQRDFWFLDRVTRGRGTYNVAATMRWPVPPDIGVVTGIAEQIAERQPALRTRLAVADDVLYALVGDQAGVQLDVSAIHAVPSSWDTIVADLVREPIDPGGAGTVRLRLLSAPADPGQPARDGARLCAISHHALIDGRSLAGFLVEVCSTASTPGGTGSRRYTPGVSAAAHLTGFRRHHDDDVTYWTRRLRPVTRPSTSERRRDLVAGSPDAGSVALRLDHARRRAVADFAAARRSSAFLVLVAAFLEALRHGGYGEDLVVGISVDGRPATVDRGEYGCFTTVLPVRVDAVEAAGAGSAAEVHARLRDTFLDALDHATITLRDVQSIAGRVGLTEPYRYMATMLASAGDIQPLSSGTKVDLALTMIDRDGATDCHFVYRPGVLSRAEVTAVTAAFARAVASLTGHRGPSKTGGVGRAVRLRGFP